MNLPNCTTIIRRPSGITSDLLGGQTLNARNFLMLKPRKRAEDTEKFEHQSYEECE